MDTKEHSENVKMHASYELSCVLSVSICVCSCVLSDQHCLAY